MGYAYPYGSLLIVIATSSFIWAFFHGLGFSIFGYGSIKPTYWQRFVIQFLAGVLAFVAIHVLGKTGFKVLDATLSDGLGLLFLFALVYSVIVHLSISVCCFYLYRAKGNIQAAIKTPIIISGFYFILPFALSIIRPLSEK